jgi:putative tricarboxylic transport membrane protein
MEALSQLAGGFAEAITPLNLLFALLGVLLGTAVGVLPGIGPAMTVALLLPITYVLDPTAAFIMFAGIYYGGMYGGSTTAILLNTPGESASMVSALEGNLMAKAGRAAPALATAAIGSFVAATVGTLLLTFVAQPFADIAVHFTPADYVGLMAVAFVTVATLLGASPLRGIASLLIGLTIGLVGIETQTGQARLTFGVPALLDGIDVVVVVVALFAIGEVFRHALKGGGGGTVEPLHGPTVMSREDWRRSWPAWLRGTAYGFPIGALPAGGAEIPTFLSYATERRLSKHKEEFGQGAIEGVAGPEAANNAAAAGVLVPLLTIGLPTSATAAVILTAFQSYGLQPGPTLFEESGPLVYALLASLYIGNVMLLVLNLPLARVWARLLKVPAYGLYAGILVFATLGTLATGGGVADLVILYVIGLLGVLMAMADVPVAPAIVGLILGPLFETQLSRTLLISGGDWSALFDTTLSICLWIVAAIALVAPFVWQRVRRNAVSAGEPERDPVGR